MKYMVVIQSAKLNLSLDIVGVREDGYHLMEMVMQTINLCDVVKVTCKWNEKIIIIGNYPGVSFDETNIAYKVAVEFFKCTGIRNRGIEISINKNIPVGAGLGGGSADGAAVLQALNKLYKAKLSIQELTAIGVKVSADIPFFLVEGTAFVSGIGECVLPIKPLPKCHILLCKPTVSISTSEAFKKYDSAEIRNRPDIAAMRQAIEDGDIYAVADAMGNVFEEVIKCDEIDYVKDIMRKCGGLHPMMTGSGSAVFSIFVAEHKANECKEWLRRAQLQAFVCKCI